MARRAKPARISGRRRPGVERLESRQLLAVTVQSFPLPVPTAQATGITSGPGGLLWFAETTTQKPTTVGAIGSINPTTKAIGEVPIPYAGSNPQAIVEGPDGDLWYTDPGTNSIGQYDTIAHGFARYTVPTANSGVTGITVGPDGNLWFTEINTGKVGEINPTTHAIVDFPLTKSTSQPGDIVVGHDGNLWFTETGIDSIGTFNPTTHASADFGVGANGFIPETDLPIVVEPDGTLFFGTSAIIGRGGPLYAVAEMNPTTHAVVQYDAAFASGAAVGPNGKIYFNSVPSIGEFDPATKAITYSLGINTGPVPTAAGIALGPDGNLWFSSGGRIGEATVLPANQDIVAGSLLLNDTFSATPIPGRTVYVDLNGDGMLDAGDPSAVTDANGQFTINDVPPGNSTLRVVNEPGDVTSVLALSLSGGQILQSETLFLQPTTAILPLTYSLAPFGTTNPDVTTAEVTGLYNIVLGRAPDAPGLAFWTGAIKNGTVSYAQVASDFLHSTAYDDRVIAADYQTFVGRAPSQSEIDAWAGLMQKGTSEEQVAALMIASPEFNALHPDNSSFVQALYNDLLGRQASASEVAAWDSSLAGGASRASVSNLFIHSQGAAQRAVDGFYQIAFGRWADPSGEAFWVGALERSSTLTDVALDFLTSTGSIQRANATVQV